jgi:hypothetical protein
MPSLLSPVRFLLLVAAPLLFLAACRDPIRTYEVPKTRAAAAPSATSAATAPAASPAQALHWHALASWREEPPAGFRRGSFKLGPADQQADLSITAFPGPAGGLLENINRWRGQLSLPPLADHEELATPLADAAMPAMLWVELDGGPAGILGGIVPHGPETWFFKLSGPAPTLAATREEFRTFLLSIHPSTEAAKSASPDTPPTSPHVSALSNPATETAAPAARPSFVPDHWEEKPASGMRVSSFLIRGPAGSEAEADLSVIPLENDGGGLASNLNRWRGQLGLAALPEARIPELTTPVALPGGDGVLVDFVSEEGLLRDGSRARILGIITVRGAQTWFFKMTGHDQLVAGEREALLAFARRFPLPAARP